MGQAYRAAPPAKGGSVNRSVRTPRPRALIVDADESFLAFAAEALHSFRPGFEVATAHDLAQAAEWLDTFYPDLLLLGSDADRADVAAFAERLRDDERTRRCRILDYAEERGRLSLPVLLHRVRGAMDH